jgi:hypothetical protein
MAVAVVLVACGAAGLGGCSSGSASSDGAPATTTTTPGSPSAADFCAVYASVPADAPESYVGSAQHLADIERLVAVAPNEIAGQLESFRIFVASGGITDDPASKDTANFPPLIRADVETILVYVDANC